MLDRREVAKIKELRIGITGSPGTGKRTIGKELGRLTGQKVISINTIAINTKSGKKIRGEFVVDIRKLRDKKIETRGSIVVGHLLSLAVPSSKLDFVAILRCSPEVLRIRYLARRYSRRKIRENIEAELLDLVSYSALRTYGRGKVSEFDTSQSKNPARVAKRILETIQGKRPKAYGIAKWSESASKSDNRLLRIMRS